MTTTLGVSRTQVGATDEVGFVGSTRSVRHLPYSWSSPGASTFPKKYFQTEGSSWMNSPVCENVVKVQEISSLTHSVIGRH